MNNISTLSIVYIVALSIVVGYIIGDTTDDFSIQRIVIQETGSTYKEDGRAYSPFSWSTDD